MEDDLRQGDSSNLPTDKQLKQLNWPALAFPHVWCFFHRLYPLGFISLIPIVNLFTRFYLLIRGNRLDWERNKDRGIENYFKRIKRWNWGTAIFFLCVLGIWGIQAEYETLTGGFSWREYSFENDQLLLSLPFSLKSQTPKSFNENIAYAKNFQGGDDRLNITLSFTELKAEYEFDLEQMIAGALEALRESKDIRLISHKYVEMEYENYPAKKMKVDFISDNTKYVGEYVYILVGKNRCWYLCSAYPTGRSKSKEASDRVFSSIKLK